MLVHGLILSGFLIYSFFLADPLFDRFEAVEGESRLIKTAVPAETKNGRYSVGKLGTGTNIIEVTGWAFIEGQNSENCKKFIALKSDNRCYVFDTKIQKRPGVTKAFASLGLDLDMSGFVCTIPIRKIRNGEYLLGIYFRKGDIEASRYTDKVLVKSREGIEWTELTSKVQNISLPEETKAMRFGVPALQETKKNGKQLIGVRGWAFIKGQTSENSRIYVVLKSSDNVYVYDTLAQLRPDITKYFEADGENLDYSGFRALLPKGEIQDGTYRLGIYIKKDGVEALQYSGKFITK